MCRFPFTARRGVAAAAMSSGKTIEARARQSHLHNMLYREATLADVPGMAQVRAGDWESEEYWRERIPFYLTGQSHPRQALGPRIAFVCLDDDVVAGFIAGHLTQRFGCDGELEWISVRPQYRRHRVASGLLRLLAGWFRD